MPPRRLQRLPCLPFCFLFAPKEFPLKPRNRGTRRGDLRGACTVIEMESNDVSVDDEATPGHASIKGRAAVPASATLPHAAAGAEVGGKGTPSQLPPAVAEGQRPRGRRATGWTDPERARFRRVAESITCVQDWLSQNLMIDAQEIAKKSSIQVTTCATRPSRPACMRILFIDAVTHPHTPCRPQDGQKMELKISVPAQSVPPFTLELTCKDCVLVGKFNGTPDQDKMDIIFPYESTVFVDKVLRCVHECHKARSRRQYLARATRHSTDSELVTGQVRQADALHGKWPVITSVPVFFLCRSSSGEPWRHPARLPGCCTQIGWTQTRQQHSWWR